MLAVGNRLYHSDKWKTFHDFLLGQLASNTVYCALPELTSSDMHSA